MSVRCYQKTVSIAAKRFSIEAGYTGLRAGRATENTEDYPEITCKLLHIKLGE